MAASTTPFPLLPPFAELHNHHEALQPLNYDTRARLSEIDPSLAPIDAWRTAIDFLAATRVNFEYYRPAMKTLEIMLQWSWLVERVDVMSWDDATAQRFIAFTYSPPDDWAASNTYPRLLEKSSPNFSTRPHNPKWRMFHRHNVDGSRLDLSRRNLLQTIKIATEFFSYCHERRLSLSLSSPVEDDLDGFQNPMSNIDIKQLYETVKRPEVRYLSPLAMEAVLMEASRAAAQDDSLEPVLFIIAIAMFSSVPLSHLGKSLAGGGTAHNFQNTGPRKLEFVGSYARYPMHARFHYFMQRYVSYLRAKDENWHVHQYLFPTASGAFPTSSDALVRLMSGLHAHFVQDADRSKIFLDEELDILSSLNFSAVRRAGTAAGYVVQKIRISRE
ncbi:hypothetical protein BV326_04944 [Pseudomonas syringae pv. actinidiae]|uniref:hypothetical protein n=1 Tax=Pseudomonas syringae TaxID=317 RepID=UPI000A24EC0D|nr:hypothetical protein [Pseudomonas syringae]OSR66126.1 hypothetical protein BV326_04944 [Pseudomonas syringae pv. actinidiae]